MVGLVIVSHSRALADALANLVKQVASPDVPIVVAAGIGENRQEFGTDAVEISEAIQSVYSPDGVLIMMDLGSAVLSAQMALELLPPEMSPLIRFCAAPLVEGCIAASVQIGLGSDLDTVCQEAMQARDRSWLEAAGLVLVRQRPGSAKGVLFATIEDETGIANVVVWAKTFEKYRRVLLSSGELSIRGRVQREGDVVHLVAHHLTDLTPLLASVGHRDAGFPLAHGRGDELHHGGPRIDPRGAPRTPATRNLGNSYGHIDEIRVRTRDFR